MKKVYFEIRVKKTNKNRKVRLRKFLNRYTTNSLKEVQPHNNSLQVYIGQRFFFKMGNIRDVCTLIRILPYERNNSIYVLRNINNNRSEEHTSELHSH